MALDRPTLTVLIAQAQVRRNAAHQAALDEPPATVAQEAAEADEAHWDATVTWLMQQFGQT